MSTTITTRLDEDPDPDSAGVARGASPEGERSDALALRAVPMTARRRIA
jgi:hypothetical protein